MTAAGAAIIVDGLDDLTDALASWLDHPGAAGLAGAAGRAVVEANRGATALTVAALLDLARGASS